MKKMKPSGVEWIGEIPQEWEINSAFQIFEQVKNKNIGLRETNLLSLSYGKIKRKSISTVGGLLPENFDGYNIIEGNDIVLRLTDLQNDHTSLRVGLATERGIVTSAYLTLRNKSSNFAEYLYYYSNPTNQQDTKQDLNQPIQSEGATAEKAVSMASGKA